MTPGEGVTLGELFRSMGKIEKSVDDGFKSINERFDGLADKFVSKELYESEREAILGRIDEVRKSRGRLVTTTLAVLATVVDAFYFLTHIHS